MKFIKNTYLHNLNPQKNLSYNVINPYHVRGQKKVVSELKPHYNNCWTTASPPVFPFVRVSVAAKLRFPQRPAIQDYLDAPWTKELFCLEYEYVWSMVLDVNMLGHYYFKFFLLREVECGVGFRRSSRSAVCVLLSR